MLKTLQLVRGVPTLGLHPLPFSQKLSGGQGHEWAQERCNSLEKKAGLKVRLSHDGTPGEVDRVESVAITLKGDGVGGSEWRVPPGPGWVPLPSRQSEVKNPKGGRSQVLLLAMPPAGRVT